MYFTPEKKLGFGLMRLPRNSADAADIDLEQVKRMVDLFLEKGFTYFDTAWMYNGFASESAVREVLTSRHPRESFTLATKLHAGFVHSFEDRDRIFNAQLEKTGAGYFDYYLLHGIEAGMLPTYEKYDCFSWLLGKKAEGLVKHAGFSFHDQPELLDRFLTAHPEMEFVQLQINYLDWESEWVKSRACSEVCVKHGKPVIVIDMGTATTVSAIAPDGGYLGCAIAPGVRISMNALAAGAAQISQINIEQPKNAIGTNTADSVKSGVLYGYAGLLDGLISRFESEMGAACTVVATGGLSEEITRCCTHKVIHDKDLLVKGLFLIYNKNV